MLEPKRHRQRRRRFPLPARLSVPLLGAAAHERRHGVALHETCATTCRPTSSGPRPPALPETTLEQAASFQAPNGGMTYFVPQDQYVSPYLSAYTALAFAWLREDGHEIPAAVETKLHDYLDTLLKRDVTPDFYTRGMASTVRAVALAALAKRGKVDRRGPRALPVARRVHELVRQGSLPAGGARRAPAAEAIAREIEQIDSRSSVRSGGKISFNEVLDDGYLRISATPLNSQLRDPERARARRDAAAARSARPATCRSSSCASSRRRAATATTGRTRRRTCSA